MLCEHGGGYLSQAEEEKKSEALQRSPQGVLNDLQSMTLGRREKSLPGKETAYVQWHENDMEHSEKSSWLTCLEYRKHVEKSQKIRSEIG